MTTNICKIFVSRIFGTKVRRTCSRGLITINGEAWRRHRRILTPAFHFAVLEKYSGIFARRAATFADKLARGHAAGESFDFMPHICTFVTDTVIETAFGIQGGEERDPAARKEFIRATENAFQVQPLYHPCRWSLLFVLVLFFVDTDRSCAPSPLCPARRSSPSASSSPGSWWSPCSDCPH